MGNTIDSLQIPESEIMDGAPLPFLGPLDTTAKLLENPIRSEDELLQVLCQFGGIDPSKRRESLGGLLITIHKFEQWIRREIEGEENFGFYQDLLPKIQTWCCEFDQRLDLPLLTQLHDEKDENNRSGKGILQNSLSMTQRQVRHLLANQFFLNIRSVENYMYQRRKFFGNISLAALYSHASPRMLCHLAYYYQIAKLDHTDELGDDKNNSENTDDDQKRTSKKTVKIPGKTVSFERFKLISPPDWANCDQTIEAKRVNNFVERMEESDAPWFVDFANRDIHIHKIILSQTQEEVLFSACPEAFPSMLVCERLADDEAVIIRNTTRFSDYTGYLRSFQYDGFYHTSPESADESKNVNILVIDAVTHAHFTKPCIDRDLNKAYLSFLQCNQEKIVTGHWGCGVFGGDKPHKFLQQVMAARLANCSLDYSTYKEPNSKAQFDFLLKIIEEGKITVGQLYIMQLGFIESEHQEFLNYAVERLVALAEQNTGVVIDTSCVSLTRDQDWFKAKKPNSMEPINELVIRQDNTQQRLEQENTLGQDHSKRKKSDLDSV